MEQTPRILLFQWCRSGGLGVFYPNFIFFVGFHGARSSPLIEYIEVPIWEPTKGKIWISISVNLNAPILQESDKPDLAEIPISSAQIVIWTIWVVIKWGFSV